MGLMGGMSKQIRQTIFSKEGRAMRYITVISGVVTLLAFAATASAGSFEDKAQVTVGGAEYLLNGHIVKIEQDAYWIRKASGDVVRVGVTDETHLICPTRPNSKGAKMEVKPGSGFRIGDCPFIPGDTVKAEISDLGTASLVRFDIPPPSETVQLGLPQGWEGADIPHGVLSLKTGPRYPVYTKDGHPIGNFAGTLTDTKLDAGYGLIEQPETRQMMAVPMTELKQDWSEANKPRVVLMISKNNLGEMNPPAFQAANRISIPEIRDFWAKKTAAPEPIVEPEVDVAIDISEKAFHITKGATTHGFTLLAGMPTVIQLRNRDLEAHEFVSTLFRDVPFRISGHATLVRTERASGVRIDPGHVVTLEFIAPTAKEDQYGATESLYDVFWCNVHGKEHGQKMRGELAIIETRGEVGGG